MNIGNMAVREKLAGRLYFKRIGAPALVDLGNVQLTKHEPKLDRAQAWTANKGWLQTTRESVGKAEPRWLVKLEEQAGENLKVLNLAREVETRSGETIGVTVVVDSLFRLALVSENQDGSQTFKIGTPEHGHLTSLLSVAFTFSDYAASQVAYEEGTHYTVDLAAGTVTFLPLFLGDMNEIQAAEAVVVWSFRQEEILIFEDSELSGGIEADEWHDLPDQHLRSCKIYNSSVWEEASGIEVDLVNGRIRVPQAEVSRFTTAQATVQMFYVLARIKSYTLLTDAFVRGTALLVLSGQGGGSPRERITFAAELAGTDQGEDDGQKFNDYTLGLLATSAPVVQMPEQS